MSALSKLLSVGNLEILERHSQITWSSTLTMSSTPPLIFKRTKSKPAQRTRQSSPDNAKAEEATETGEDSPSTLATKLKNKVKRSKPKSRLSFGGDDDEVCVLNAPRIQR